MGKSTARVRYGLLDSMLHAMSAGREFSLPGTCQTCRFANDCMAKGGGKTQHRSNEDALLGLDHQRRTHEEGMVLELENA